jgi:hypothetical protein
VFEAVVVLLLVTPQLSPLCLASLASALFCQVESPALLMKMPSKQSSFAEHALIFELQFLLLVTPQVSPLRLASVTWFAAF